MTENIPLMDQYTVTIGPTTVAKYCAGLAGPFQVINLSTTATIWLADNSVVSDGHGIPLYPGTGMVWTGSQGTHELWGALGTDTQSVGQTVGVLIGATVRDWQANPIAIATAVLNSGLILVDDPVLVLDSGSTVINVGNNPITYPNINVSTYQNIIIRFTLTNNAVTAGQLLGLSFNWYDSAGNFLCNDNYQWPTADLTTLQTVLPCRGSVLQISVGIGGGGGTTATFLLRVVASHRAYSDQMRQMGVAGNRVIASGTSVGLAAGANFVVTWAVRYDGPAFLTVVAIQGGPPDGLEVAVTDLVTGRNIFYAMPLAIAATGFTRTACMGDFIIPRDSCQINIRNNSAGAATITAELVAAPEST